MNEQQPDHRSIGQTVPNWHGALILLAAPSILTGCGAGTPEGPQVVQRDSAGIVIVENSEEMAFDAGGWSVDPEPFLSIGTLDGNDATALHQVDGAHRTPDGGVAIVNGGSLQLRVFDASGVYLRSFGREGDGPGEFRDMRYAGVVGQDTVVVTDVTRRRLALIHPQEGILSTVPLREEASRFPVPSGVFADGRVVFGREGVRVEWTEDFEEGPARFNTEWRTSDLQGRFAGSLGFKPGTELVLTTMEYDGELRVRRSNLPLAKQPMSAVASTRFYFGSQDAFEIEAVDPDGSLRRLIRVTEDPHPVTMEAWDLWVEDTIQSMARDEEHERRLRGVYEEAEQYMPSFFPAHGLLKTDALDHLWVEEYPLPGKEADVWSVFDSEGVRLARVTLPLTMAILEIGRDYLMGLVRDEYDVEYVQLFRLRRGE